MQDVEEAIKEANRAAEAGLRQLLHAAQSGARPLAVDDDYLPLWMEIEELGKPISTHDSASSSVPSFGDRMDTHVSGHILSHPFEAMAAMAGLIWYGIFEKFPKLKVVHVEADGGWVPYWLQRMEQHWDFSGNAEHEYLKARPTEYFKRNVCVAFRGDEPTMKAAVDIGRRRQFHLGHRLSASRRHLSVGDRRDDASSRSSRQARRKILWDNAARAFQSQLSAH